MQIRDRSHDGFTLIEMLVVLMIMGLLVGLVSAIARPDEQSLLRVEVDRLAKLLDLAAMESRLSGKPIAWWTDGSGYRFAGFNEGSGWSDFAEDNFLRARTLPAGMSISHMRVENVASPEQTRLEFNPYGSAPIFSVRMSLGAANYTLANSPVGDVRVLQEDGANEQRARP